MSTRHPLAHLLLAVTTTLLALTIVACGPGRGGGGGGGGGGGDNNANGGTNNNANENNGGENNNALPMGDPCSLEVPDGECVKGYTCIDGACVGLGLVCSEGQPEGECPFGERCVDGRCFSDNDLCSAANDIGVCPEGQFCNGGVCTTRDPCGPAEPSGSCEDGEVCFQATCRDKLEICGAGHTGDGECLEGRTCLEGVCHLDSSLCSEEQRGGRCAPGLTCSGGACMDVAEACSLANPDGACAGGYDCFDGFCRDADELCSASNPHGFCSGTLSCIDGECLPQNQDCSVTVFDGLCPEGLICSAGVCVGDTVACDDVFQHGSCPGGSACLCGGTCEDVVPGDATPEQEAAINRTNFLRNSIGLWSIRQDARINEAATNHAAYIANEANEAHDEFQTDSPYYTGTKFWDRMASAGYTGSPGSEVIAYIGDAERSVDELVATVYHRIPFFDPYSLEMGYGGEVGPQAAADVINFGNTGTSCIDELLVVFPPAGATDVPVSWDGFESPTPPAPPQGYPSGPIISVHGTHTLNIQTHRILIGDSPLDHTHLTAETDPNGSVGNNVYFLYPHKPLREKTEYLVEVTGTHAGEPFRLRWSFTTE